MADFSLGGYALDLGPLEKSSGVVINDRKRSTSLVDSEDDGPSDFTQNLAQWMKGTGTYNQSDSQKSKNAEPQAKEQSIEQPTLASDHVQPTGRATEHQTRDPYDFANDSLFTEPLGSSTPSPRFMVKKPTVEDVPDDSVYPLPPPGQPRFTECRSPLPRAPDSPSPLSQRNSGSEPGVPIDTPEPSQCSPQEEASIAVKPSSPSNSFSQHHESAKPLLRQNSGSQHAPQAETLSRGNSGSLHVASPDPSKLQTGSSRQDTSAAANTNSIQALCGVIQASEHSPNNSRCKEDPPITSPSPPRSRRNSHSKQEPSPAMLPAPLSRLNTETKQNNAAEEVFSHISALQAEVERLRHENRQLRTANDNLASANAEYHTAYQTLEREQEQQQAVHDKLEHKDTQQTRAYQTLGRDYADLQIKHNNLKVNHDNLEEQFREKRKEFISEVNRLNEDLAITRSRVQDHESATAQQINVLKSQHEAHIIELQRKHESEVRELESAIAREINVLKTQHEAHINELQAKQESEIRTRESATARQIDILNSQHEARIVEHQGKYEYEVQERENAFSRDHKAMTMELESSQAALSSAQNEVSTTKERLVDLEIQLSDMHAVNREMEVRFATVVEAREEEWTRRMELLFREREKMSKALMIEWGKREVGDARSRMEGKKGQAYRYRYAKA